MAGDRLWMVHTEYNIVCVGTETEGQTLCYHSNLSFAQMQGVMIKVKGQAPYTVAESVS